MKKVIIQICLVLIVAYWYPMESLAQNISTDQIAFLKIEIEDSTIRIIESKIVQGKLKKPRKCKEINSVFFEVKSSMGKILWNGYMDDPLKKKIEYVNDSGQLESQLITLTKATFILRIPFNKEFYSIYFYKIDTTIKNAENKPNKQIHKHLIGSINLKD